MSTVHSKLIADANYNGTKRSTKLGNRNNIITRGKRMKEGINVIFTRFEFFKRLTLTKLKKVEENAQGIVSTNRCIYSSYKSPIKKKINKRGKVDGK